jgi:ABC-type branched-subunit amino acid transport system ATPase component
LLAQQTSLWLLDEPVAGLDPKRAETTTDFIERMNKERGISILLVEHNYEVAFKLAQKVCVIKNGIASEKFEPDAFRQKDFLDNYVYV